MKVILLKPYSIWTAALTPEAKKGNYIAIFTLRNEMWKESNGCLFGISTVQMDQLLTLKIAIKL